MTRLLNSFALSLVAILIGTSTVVAQASVSNLGPGTATGSDPVLNVGLPIVGNSIPVDLSAAPATVQGALLASVFSPNTSPFLGGTIYVDLDTGTLIPFATDANGDWSTTFAALPPSTIGAEFALQALILDGGLFVSNGIRATVGDAFANLRVLHASPDAPAVNVLVNGQTALSDVDFKVATGFVPLVPATYALQVDGIVPGGTATVIGPVNAALAPATDTTVIAVDNVANITPLIITNPTTAVPVNSARVQVVHGSPAAPQVEVFVTAPGGPIVPQASIGSFSFQGSLGPVVVPAGDYQIRVRTTGMSPAVVFDSGTVTLPEGADLMIVAVDNTTTGAAPISLLVLDGQGVSEILDVNTPAEIRVVHASPDAPPVDVVVNDDFANPLIPALAFPNATAFAPVAPDTYNVKVAAAGSTNPVIDANLTLEAGTQTTVIAVDVLASIMPLVISEDQRRVATEAKLRVVHASPTAGLVDVYLTAPGTNLQSATPALTGVPFMAFTGFLSVAQGSYDITITPTGTTTAAIGPIPVTLNNSGIYTAIARDAQNGGTPLAVITLDDL